MASQPVKLKLLPRSTLKAKTTTRLGQAIGEDGVSVETDSSGTTVGLDFSSESLVVGTQGPSTYSKLMLAGTDSNPSLTHNGTTIFALNGSSSATALVAGVATTSPNPSWLQSRNWFGDAATHLLLNPAGGGVAINTTVSGLASGLTNGVQISDNWTNSSSYAPPGGAFAIAELNIYNSANFAGGIGVFARTSTGSSSAQGISSYAYADHASSRGAWPLYLEGHRLTANDYAYGTEIAIVNRYNNVIEINPFNSPAAGGTVGIQLESGNTQPSSNYTEYTASVGLMLVRNDGAGQTNLRGFAHGIIFRYNSLDSTLFDPPDAIALAGNTSKHAISWWSDSSTRAWTVYSDASSGANSFKFATGGVDATGYHSNSVVSGPIYHRVLSGTVDFRMQANSSSALGDLGTVSNHSWNILVNNTAVGRVSSTGLSNITIAANALTIAGGAPGILAFTSSAINFNSANTDTTFAITLPTGFTRYRINAVIIDGASASLTTSTFGVFTATGAGGTAIVTSGTANTISTASENTNNNTQFATINNQSTQCYAVASTPNLYFRVQTAQGSAATANVTILLNPLP